MLSVWILSARAPPLSQCEIPDILSAEVLNKHKLGQQKELFQIINYIKPKQHDSSSPEGSSDIEIFRRISYDHHSTPPTQADETNISDIILLSPEVDLKHTIDSECQEKRNSTLCVDVCAKDLREIASPWNISTIKASNGSLRWTTEETLTKKLVVSEEPPLRLSKQNSIDGQTQRAIEPKQTSVSYDDSVFIDDIKQQVTSTHLQQDTFQNSVLGSCVVSTGSSGKTKSVTTSSKQQVDSDICCTRRETLVQNFKNIKPQPRKKQERTSKKNKRGSYVRSGKLKLSQSGKYIAKQEIKNALQTSRKETQTIKKRKVKLKGNNINAPKVSENKTTSNYISVKSTSTPIKDQHLKSAFDSWLELSEVKPVSEENFLFPRISHNLDSEEGETYQSTSTLSKRGCIGNLPECCILSYTNVIWKQDIILSSRSTRLPPFLESYSDDPVTMKWKY
ncbi:uncharacterized protein LOC143228593 [Tachypleus tridentatus]|uniref:uncharacterized protein LOC143228593 n=1 Tax=Tachypleus tridentatus TaxID=6853 RepID=UPI003FD13395